MKKGFGPFFICIQGITVRVGRYSFSCLGVSSHSPTLLVPVYKKPNCSQHLEISGRWRPFITWSIYFQREQQPFLPARRYTPRGWEKGNSGEGSAKTSLVPNWGTVGGCMTWALWMPALCAKLPACILILSWVCAGAAIGILLNRSECIRQHKKPWELKR